MKIDNIQNPNYTDMQLEHAVQTAAENAMKNVLLPLVEHLYNGIEQCNNRQNLFDDGRLTYTPAELAKAFGISEPTAYELMKRKDFPSFMVGRKYLVGRQALNEWLMNRGDSCETC